MSLRSRSTAGAAVFAAVAAMLVAPLVGATTAAAASVPASRPAATGTTAANPAAVGADALARMVRGLGAGGRAAKATGHARPGGKALTTRPATASRLATPAATPDAGCNVGFDNSITQFPQSDGGVSVSVVFSASIDCSPDVAFDAAAILVNRTAPYDGLVMAAGNEVTGSGSATSVGAVGIGDVYPGANDVETVFAVNAYSPFGWAGCFDSPGVRVLSCSGVGTTTLSAVLGSGVYSTGKKDPSPQAGQEWLVALGKCMDVDSGGFWIDINSCNGSVSQRWRVEADGTIRTQDNNCLDVNNGGTAPRTKIDKTGCNGTGAQQWIYDPNAKSFRNPQANMCIDTPFANAQDGTQLEITNCNGTAAQTWSRQPLV